MVELDGVMVTLIVCVVGVFVSYVYGSGDSRTFVSVNLNVAERIKYPLHLTPRRGEEKM